MKKRKVMPKFFMYEVIIIVGAIMALMTLAKLIGFVNFSSDWLWFVAGLGLVVEGIISLKKQQMFDKKYKIILKED